MRLPHRFLSLVILLVNVGTFFLSPIRAAHAQTSTDTCLTPAELDRKIHAYLSAYAKRNRFSGVVLIAVNGKPLVRRAYGFADWKKRIPNTPETRFRIFSMSKAFTAAAILLLQERGKLNVRDFVAKHIPDWPNEWKNVRVRHLLTHTSGIETNSAFRWLEKNRLAQATSDFVADSTANPTLRPALAFPTGTRHEYSNFGYVVLADILAKVSGQSYRDFLRGNLFLPLGMTETDAWQKDIVEKRANGYSDVGPNARPEEQTTNQIIGAGDIVTTADDLLRWDQALRGDKLPSADSRRAMFTDFGSGYGYGWFVGRDDEELFSSHTGGGSGFWSHRKRAENDGFCQIVLSNDDASGGSANFPDDITRFFYSNVALPKPDYVDMPPHLQQKYVGTYRGEWRGGAVTDLTVSRGAFADTLNITGAKIIGALEITTITTARLQSTSGICAEFARNKSGRMEMVLRWPEIPLTLTFRKIR